MSRIPELKHRRDKDIKEAYDKLEAETVSGLRNRVAKYRREAILEILSKKFYLSPDYISNIVISFDKDPNQLNLFDDKDESQLNLFENK